MRLSPRLLTTLLVAFVAGVAAMMAADHWTEAAKKTVATAKTCAEVKNYDGAFKLAINLEKNMREHKVTADSLPLPYYYTARVRYDIYQSMGNKPQAEQWLRKMADYARRSGDKEANSDMLFTEAQYYYSVGNNAQGDRCIARLIKTYDTSADYKVADKAYKDLIDKAVASKDAALVEHTYESYMAWSDSIEALNADMEINKVKEEMADTVAEMERMDHTIAKRTGTMVTFITLFVIAVGALAVGALFYWRVVMKNRRIRRRAEEADARNAAKSAMLQNMSTSLKPTLDRLDPENPAVQQLRGYVDNVGTLSEVEAMEPKDPATFENVNLENFCKEIADEFRPVLKKGVTLHLDGTRGWAKIDAPEVRKILEHLLDNAAKFTPEGGKITLAYRKRGATTHQFIVTDTGSGIPAEEREDLFKAFNASRDISDGDGLGLPICALRADKMGGSLTLDPTVTRGTSFILTIHTDNSIH